MSQKKVKLLVYSIQSIVFLVCLEKSHTSIHEGVYTITEKFRPSNLETSIVQLGIRRKSLTKRLKEMMLEVIQNSKL